MSEWSLPYGSYIRRLSIYFIVYYWNKCIVNITFNRLYSLIICLAECERIDTSLVIPDMMSCSIPSHCTAINCCIDVPFIGRSLYISVDLDACSNRLTVTIEKFAKHIQLFDYEWGTWQKFDIKGVFIIEWEHYKYHFPKS